MPAPGPTTHPNAAGRVGAYGIAMVGEALGDDVDRWLPSVPDAWPVWEVRRQLASPETRPAEDHLDDDRCTLLLYGEAWCEIDRAAQLITLHLPEREPTGGVLHPGATLPAMVVAHWRGALNLHAGAVLLHGQAWGVLGHKGAGKSTTLAALDRAGHPVLADDMAVFDGDDVLIGPRFVDLRKGASEHFPQAIDFGRMGMRQRFRLPLSPAPIRAPFAGWLLPDWHDDLLVESIPPALRLPLLGDLVNIRVPSNNPIALLDAAAKPLLRISRPKAFEALPEYIDAILDATAPADVTPAERA